MFAYVVDAADDIGAGSQSFWDCGEGPDDDQPTDKMMVKKMLLNFRTQEIHVLSNTISFNLEYNVVEMGKAALL